MFDAGHIKSLIQIGETHTVEFKQDFDWKDADKKIKYIKGIVGLHNHDGGYLLFGIEDDGTIIGIGNDFDKLDNADINKSIRSYFQPSIHDWHKMPVVIDGLTVGVVHVQKRKTLPSVCKKDFPKLLSESDIYFRYHSETTKIKHGDLLQMLTEFSHTEQVQESKRVRKKDLQPFLKIGGSSSYTQNICDTHIRNISDNVALLKKLINLRGDGVKFILTPPQEYGLMLPGKQFVAIQGHSSTPPAYAFPWNFRVIFSDKEDNLYFQDFFREGGQDLIKDTQPMDYTGEL